MAQQNLNEAGFNATIESVEIARLYKDILRSPHDDRMSHNSWFGRPTIDEILTPFFTANANWNYTKDSNPEVDELLTKARLLVNFDETYRKNNCPIRVSERVCARVGARTSEDLSFPGLSPDPFPATISPIVP